MTVDTWFGDPEEPLLGFVTVPADGRARAGVVLCPPLGHEQILSYRALRLAADELAQRGFATVRFDYAGEGDSSGESARSDAPARWLDSISRAVDLLRASGVTEVALVGLTSGGLLAAEAARRIPSLAGLVLWDPDVSGRRFLRRQRSLHEFTLGADAGLPGQPALLSLDLHADAVAWLEALVIDPAELPHAAREVLVLGRESGGGAERLASALPDGSFRAVTGQSELLEVPGPQIRMPVEAIETMVSFLDARLPLDSRPVTVPVRAGSPVPAGNTLVREELLRIGPDALFAIETRPERGTPRATVILQPGAAEHRVGPGRFQVVMARALAADGFRVVRFDRLVTGESTTVAADEPNLVFAEEWIDDVERIADAFDDAPLATLGLCAGSWSGVRFAARRPVPLSILLSPNYFKTRTLAPGEFAALQRQGRDDFAGEGPADADGRLTLGTVKAFVRDRMPDWLWRLLAPTQLFHDPAQLLAPALRQDGNGVLVVLTPDDIDGFRSHRGFEALDRLRRRGYDVRQRVYGFGDHSLFGARIRSALIRDMHDVLAERFPVRDDAGVPHLEPVAASRRDGGS